MKPRKSVAWLGVGVAIFAGFGGVPAVAGEGVVDPFAVLEIVGEAELEAARGGGVIIINDDGTQIVALNEVNATIGTNDFDVGGSISGGAVTFSDNALGSFSGLLTQAFATAPGAIATATTSLTITLVP